MTQNAWSVKKQKGQRWRAQKGEQMKIFIIVRVIRHRGTRGDDDEGDAERPCEIIRLAATIIDQNESHREKERERGRDRKRKGYIKK